MLTRIAAGLVGAGLALAFFGGGGAAAVVGSVLFVAGGLGLAVAAEGVLDADATEAALEDSPSSRSEVRSSIAGRAGWRRADPGRELAA